MIRKYASYHVVVIGLFILVCAMFFAPSAHATDAIGRLDFAFGKSTATGVDGVVRPLAKKSDIFQGDSIQTGDGRIQIRFTDGSYMALQPNTLFKVDEYNWKGKADGSEKASYNLTKGSLRTITGLIGHTNKKNYEIRTPTATIGIRGTAFTVNQSNDGLLVTVQRGLVSISNQGGNITIGGGQSAFVHTQNSPPEMSNQSAAAEQGSSSSEQAQEQQQQEAQQATTKNAAASGEQRKPDGSSTMLTQNPISGLGYSISWTDGQSGSDPAILTDTVESTFSGTKLTTFENSNGNIDFSSAQSHDVGWDGLIGWGRWTGSVAGTLPGSEQTYDDNGGLHYVFGKLAPDSAITARNGTTVRYDLVGNTSPSTFDGNTYSLGTLSGIGGDKANVSINFAAGASTMTINAQIINSSAGVNYNLASEFGAITIPLNGTPTASFVGDKSVALGQIYVSGIFVGNNAERLGTAYDIYTEAGVRTNGTAAFAAP